MSRTSLGFQPGPHDSTPAARWQICCTTHAASGAAVWMPGVNLTSHHVIERVDPIFYADPRTALVRGLGLNWSVGAVVLVSYV